MKCVILSYAPTCLLLEDPFCDYCDTDVWYVLSSIGASGLVATVGYIANVILSVPWERD